jgi:hypothetical protein
MHSDGDTETVGERKRTVQRVRHRQQTIAHKAGNIGHVREHRKLATAQAAGFVPFEPGCGRQAPTEYSNELDHLF